MLVRLFADKLISEGQLREWASYDIRLIAETWGLRSSEFAMFSEPAQVLSNLSRYPLSVIHRIKQALDREIIDVNQAANLLDVDVSEISVHLLDLPPTDSQAQVELEQLLL